MKYCHAGISRISPNFTMFLMFHTLLCSTSFQTVTRMARTRTGDSCCLHYGEAAFPLTLLAIRLVLSRSGPAQHWPQYQFTPMIMTQVVFHPGLGQPCHVRSCVPASHLLIQMLAPAYQLSALRALDHSQVIADQTFELSIFFSLASLGDALYNSILY